MSTIISHAITHGLRKATGRVFCQYCRVDKPNDEFAWLTPRACCTKCRDKGTRRARR